MEHYWRITIPLGTVLGLALSIFGPPRLLFAEAGAKPDSQAIILKPGAAPESTNLPPGTAAVRIDLTRNPCGMGAHVPPGTKVTVVQTFTDPQDGKKKLKILVENLLFLTGDLGCDGSDFAIVRASDAEASLLESAAKHGLLSLMIGESSPTEFAPVETPSGTACMEVHGDRFCLQRGRIQKMDDQGRGTPGH